VLKSRPGTAASLPCADRQNAADAGIVGKAEPTNRANAITRRRKVSMFEFSLIRAFNMPAPTRKPAPTMSITAARDGR
jgi:hypothetical protein